MATGDILLGRCLVCQELTPESHPGKLCVEKNSRLLFAFLECISGGRDAEKFADNITQFCSTCEKFLREWRRVSFRLSYLNHRIEQIKLYVSSKILSTNCNAYNITKYEIPVNKEIDASSDLTPTETRDLSLSTLQCLRDIRDALLKEYCAKVVVPRLDPAIAEKYSKKLEADKKAQSTESVGLFINVEDRDSSAEPLEDPLALSDHELEDGEEKFNSECGSSKGDEEWILDADELDNDCDSQKPEVRYQKKTSRLSSCNDSEKKKREFCSIAPGGPNEFIYRGKYNIYYREGYYHCGSCSVKRKRKSGAMYHIRQAHVYHRKRKATPPVVSVGPNEFCYMNDFRFAVNETDGLYCCSTCPIKKEDESGILNHIREAHMQRRKLRIKSTAVSVGPNEFVFANKFRFTVDEDDGLYHCSSCPIKKKDENGMLLHIRQTHVGGFRRSRSRKEISPGQFLYRGKYPFSFVKGPDYYSCGSCDFQTPDVRSMYGHIRGKHFSGETITYPCVQVGPNKFMYADQYPIYLVNCRYFCGLCHHNRLSKPDLYPHIRDFHFPNGKHYDSLRDDSAGTIPPPNNYESQYYGWDEEISAVGENTGEATQEGRDIGTELSAACNQSNEETSDECGITTVSDGAGIESSGSVAKGESRTLKGTGWKEIGNGRYAFKSFVVELQDGLYKCLTCNKVDPARVRIFSHVSTAHVRYLTHEQLSHLKFDYKGHPYSFSTTLNKYVCGVCPCTFIVKGRMTEHIRNYHICTERQKFICDICGAELTTTRGLKGHRACHAERTFQCTQCDKAFRSKAHLRSHQKIHLGDVAKTHQCEYCGLKFFTKRRLGDHVTVHTGEKPFPCDKCDQTFSSTLNRRYHMKKYHGGAAVASMNTVAMRIKLYSQGAK